MQRQLGGLGQGIADRQLDLETQTGSGIQWDSQNTQQRLCRWQDLSVAWTATQLMGYTAG
jgi:hypothetical protein